MFKIIDFLLSPFARIGGFIVAGVIFVGAIYGKGRSDAATKIRGKANEDALRRTQSAVRAGDHVDTRPERLRDNDGHRRD